MINFNKFHQHKCLISIDNINVNKIVVSNKVSFGKKNFKFLLAIKMPKVRPLWIFLPKMRAHRRDFDKAKCMSF